MAKPSDFYVGILSFLAVLLPGIIGVSILEPICGDAIRGSIVTIQSEDRPARWVLFIIASYVLGHLLFLIGSRLDGVYEWLRKKMGWFTDELAFKNATDIKESILEGDEARALNTFQWARAVLTALFSDAAADIHTLEAEGKFFRSLLVVMALSAIAFVFEGRFLAPLIILVLSPFCFARFCERRAKSSRQAYTYIIALHRLKKLEATRNQNSRTDLDDGRPSS